MNVVVVRTDGSWYTRPDTTVEREEKDFYLPDEYRCVTARRCIFIKIIKAGKAVGRKFAGRYFDSFGKGWVLYGGEQLCPYIDASTVLGQETESCDALEGVEYQRIVESLCAVTSTMSVRIGDFIVFEGEETEGLQRGSELGDFRIL